jgi:hypothetical protein
MTRCRSAPVRHAFLARRHLQRVNPTPPQWAGCWRRVHSPDLSTLVRAFPTPLPHGVAPALPHAPRSHTSQVERPRGESAPCSARGLGVSGVAAQGEQGDVVVGAARHDVVEQLVAELLQRQVGQLG